MSEIEKEVEGIKYKIRQKSFGDSLDLTESAAKSRGTYIRELFKRCIIEPEMTDEIINSLTDSAGFKLLSIVNTHNGESRNEKDFTKGQENTEK